MRRPFTILAAGAICAAAVLASPRTLAAPASTAAVAKRSCAKEIRQYGHIRSLTRTGRRFQLRFDPALWLGGVTAQRAAVEDGVLKPGEPVSNDYYIRDQDHRLLTYLVPRSAPVRILTSATRSRSITVAELAQIVKGKNPRRRPIYHAGFGFWIRVSSDTVHRLDQQYQP